MFRRLPQLLLLRNVRLEHRELLFCRVLVREKGLLDLRRLGVREADDVQVCAGEEDASEGVAKTLSVR